MITRYRKRLIGHSKKYLYHTNKNFFGEWEFIKKFYRIDVYQLPAEFLIWMQKQFIIKVRQYEKTFYDVKYLDKVLNIFICIIQKSGYRF